MDVINPIVKRWQRQGFEDPDGLWAEAADQLPWFRRWERVLEWTPPTFRWFVGGRTNLSYNCLDVHVRRGWGGHAALIAENERGERRVFTYAQLL
jgi:acetyl-CoA synthetase